MPGRKLKSGNLKVGWKDAWALTPNAEKRPEIPYTIWAMGKKYTGRMVPDPRSTINGVPPAFLIFEDREKPALLRQNGDGLWFMPGGGPDVIDAFEQFLIAWFQ